MKTDWQVGAPFVFVNVDGLGNSGNLIYESFSKYCEAMQDVVTTQLPDLLYKGERLIDEAEDVKKYAEPEFERLDVIAKGKAVMALSFDLKMISKIPAILKSTLEDFKETFEQLKKAIEEMKANMIKLKTDGMTCNSKKINSAPECYRQIYGPIKYTR